MGPSGEEIEVGDGSCGRQSAGTWVEGGGGENTLGREGEGEIRCRERGTQPEKENAHVQYIQ